MTPDNLMSLTNGMKLPHEVLQLKCEVQGKKLDLEIYLVQFYYHKAVDKWRAMRKTPKNANADPNNVLNNLPDEIFISQDDRYPTAPFPPRTPRCWRTRTRRLFPMSGITIPRKWPIDRGLISRAGKDFSHYRLRKSRKRSGHITVPVIQGNKGQCATSCNNLSYFPIKTRTYRGPQG